MKTHPSSRSRLSFTLVEMLAAMAVFSLLMLLIFSILGSAAALSDSTGRRADTSIEARQVLDRIGADINGMLIRPDVDQLYYSGLASSSKSDKMFFYTQQTGFFDSAISTADQSPLSLVGYRINTTDNPSGAPMLERLARGLILDLPSDWADTAQSTTIDAKKSTGALVYLTFPAKTSAANYPAATSGQITTVWGTLEKSIYQIGATYTSATKGDVGTLAGTFDDGFSSYYDPIGPQVFRFEVCFQLANGTYSLNPGYTNSIPTASTGLTNTVAIVVAVAMLDSKSRKLVTTAAKWNSLIKALPNPTVLQLNSSQLMDYAWNNAINTGTFSAQAGIPAAAASHVKVYQRYYYLNTPKAQ